MTYFQDGHPIAAKSQALAPVQVIKYRDYLSKDVPIHISNSRIVVRKSVFDELGGFRDTRPETFHMDDFNFMLRAGTYTPFILVQKPFTIAYREHRTNSHWDFAATADGIMEMVRSEREEKYPGGKARRSARYACIGGLSAAFAIRYCWRGGSRKQALRLLLRTSPMILAAIQNKLLRRFRNPTQPTILPPAPGDLASFSPSAA
jgi:hypothetical protein